LVYHIGQFSLLSSARQEMSTGEGGVVVLHSWKDERGSGTAQEMHDNDKLCDISNYGFNGLRYRGESKM